jgi:ABC-type transporter Mla MlaB component
MAIFRKKDQPRPAPANKPAPLKPDVKPPHSAPQPAASRQTAPKPSAIEVQEGSLTEEAAVLYANSQPEEAAAILSYAIAASGPEHKNPRAWLMLCDLYSLRGMKAEFENLALEYAIKFERSPPHWRTVETGAAEEPSRASSLITLSGALSGAAQAKLNEAKKALEQKRAVRLDVGKLLGVEPGGCVLLTRFLQGVRRERQGISLNGASQFIQVLQDALRGPHSEPWLLLLEIYELQGMQNAFEDLAVEYAVKFEVSPPSWETPPVQPKAQASEADGSDTEPDEFILEGVTNGAADPRLEELARFAEERASISINLARLSRLDFGCAGSLLSLAVKLNQSGKTVRIVEPNELVRVLLSALGIEGVASIVKA